MKKILLTLLAMSSISSASSFDWDKRKFDGKFKIDGRYYKDAITQKYRTVSSRPLYFTIRFGGDKKAKSIYVNRNYDYSILEQLREIQSIFFWSGKLIASNEKNMCKVQYGHGKNKKIVAIIRYHDYESGGYYEILPMKETENKL